MWFICHSDPAKDAKNLHEDRPLRPWKDVSQLPIWRRILNESHRERHVRDELYHSTQISLILVQYTEEEKKAFAEDPELYFKYRKEVERAINLDHACLFPGTDMQKAYL